MPLHCSCCIITSLLFPYYLWAYRLMFLLCKSNFHILTSFRLYWPTFLLCQPTFHILTSFGLYGPTFLLCQSISFIGLPRPIYFFFTSFTPMGFLLNHLVFLDPITTSLSLITFQAYWPLSQPNEFTNSFLGFPQPIYFFFTS